jgi:hypothetical protein
MMKRERSCTEHVESTVAACDARLRRVSQGTTCRDELKPEGRLAQPVDDFWTIGSRSSGVRGASRSRHVAERVETDPLDSV